MLRVIRFIFRVVLPERNELSKKKSNKNPKQTTITTGEREGEREKKKEREMGEGGGGKKREKVQMIDNGSVINKIENLCFR